jgi:hypothetical protein
LSEYIVRILGRLRPPLTVEYKDLELPSFFITVEKELVSAMPHSDIQLDADTARERLQDEISPLLVVLGAEVEKRTITLEITDIIYPTVGTATRDIACMVKVGEPPPTKDELLLKAQLARTDGIYRNLLELYIEAQVASNPRPAGAKMKERLKVRFNGYSSALASLELPENGFAFITDKQSQYKGDRHADYKMDEVPAEMDPSKRLEILTLLNDIIQRYKRYLLRTT